MVAVGSEGLSIGILKSPRIMEGRSEERQWGSQAEKLSRNSEEGPGGR